MTPVGLSVIVGAPSRDLASYMARIKVGAPKDAPILYVSDCIGIDDDSGMRAYEVVFLIGFADDVS